MNSQTDPVQNLDDSACVVLSVALPGRATDVHTRDNVFAFTNLCPFTDLAWFLHADANHVQATLGQLIFCLLTDRQAVYEVHASLARVHPYTLHVLHGINKTFCTNQY